MKHRPNAWVVQSAGQLNLKTGKSSYDLEIEGETFTIVMSQLFNFNLKALKREYAVILGSDSTPIGTVVEIDKDNNGSYNPLKGYDTWMVFERTTDCSKVIEIVGKNSITVYHFD